MRSGPLIGCGAVRRQRRIPVVSRRAGLLTAEQQESLERDGYLLVPSLLDEIVLAPMRARLDELVYQALVALDADPAQDVEEHGVVHATLGLSMAAASIAIGIRRRLSARSEPKDLIIVSTSFLTSRFSARSTGPARLGGRR